MYFPDMSPYSYGTWYREQSIAFQEVRTIGWLKQGFTYSKGKVGDRFLQKLQQMYQSPRVHIRGMRGYHQCDLCDPSLANKDQQSASSPQQIWRGSSELWIPSSMSSQLIYAAPSMIRHYIIAHEYRPPDEFIQSVQEFDLNSDWDGEEMYSQLLEQYRDRMRRGEKRF